MKWLLAAALGLCWAVNASAQWVAPPREFQLGPKNEKRVDFDRPHHAARSRAAMPLSIPLSAPPNWPFPNIDVTNSSVEQDEPMVAINPTDSLNIIIGANDDRDSRQLWTYSSSNGGNSWSDTDMPIPMESWILSATATDPSLAFTRMNTPLFVNGHLADAGSGNDVSCFTSTDEGIDWNLFSEVFQDSEGITGVISDKYFVGVDNNVSSPYYGRVYVTWVEIAGGSARIVEAYSTDNGKSWSAKHYANDSGHYTAPVPVAEPDGTLLISFVDYYPSGAIMLARSTDGGSTFAAPQLISSYRNMGPLVPPDSTGYQNIGPPDSLLGVNSFPAIAVDPTNLHPGRAYMVWCGNGNDNVTHVWLTSSDNDGATWNTPSAIEGDSVANASARFFSWIAVDPMTGNVAVDYYAARMDTVPPKRNGRNLMLNAGLYMLHSTDGGLTFVTRRISDVTFDPISGQDSRLVENETIWFSGDYIALAGRSNTWYPVWTDNRASTDNEIYTAIVQPFAPMPVMDLAAHDTIVNGKRASLISWHYVPETTFGYPLPAGYQFFVSKDGVQLSMQSSGELSYLDSNGEGGQWYEVKVLSGQYHSITDSVLNGNSSVASSIIQFSNIRFAYSPAIAGREDELSLDCAKPCSVIVTFYDALGRQLGAISDEMTSSRHEISFSPEVAGVEFFDLTETSSSGVQHSAGRISVVQQ